jgi:hypothetical protein
VQVISNDSVVEGWIIHPFSVKLVNGIRTDIKDLSNFSQAYLWTFVLEIIFIGIELVKFFGKEFQCSF